MWLEEHMNESLGTFGKEYKQVHEWLDIYFYHRQYGPKHRKKRHHLKGIEEVRNMWGSEAAQAARQHIISDLKQDNWDPEKDRIPIDEEDYIKMGLL